MKRVKNNGSRHDMNFMGAAVLHTSPRFFRTMIWIKNYEYSKVENPNTTFKKSKSSDDIYMNFKVGKSHSRISFPKLVG